MINDPLTPLQQSAFNTGRRYFSVSVSSYNAVCKEIDDKHGHPKGQGSKAITERELPLVESALKSSQNQILISIEFWKSSTIKAIIESKKSAELTFDEYIAILPTQESATLRTASKAKN